MDSISELRKAARSLFEEDFPEQLAIDLSNRIERVILDLEYVRAERDRLQAQLEVWVGRGAEHRE